MCSVERRGNVYLLTLIGDGEHRLNITLIRSLRSVLQQIKYDAGSSPSSAEALVTAGEGKFFSNGYDLDWVGSPDLTPTDSGLRGRAMVTEFQSLIGELIRFPMPTIAAVTGHASAAGMILALAHDYVVMRRDRGFLYMSEVDIGLVVPPWFAAVVRSKMGEGLRIRNVFLKAEKLTAEKAVEMGVVDLACDGAEETVAAGVRLGEELVERKWSGHVYAANRMVVMGDVLRALDDEHARVGRSRL